jgi:hypothetical protein
VVFRADLMPSDLLPVPLVAAVGQEGDADDFEAAFFGGLIAGSGPDPMFAGAADAGPLAQDGATERVDDDRMPATFRTE